MVSPFLQIISFCFLTKFSILLNSISCTSTHMLCFINYLLAHSCIFLFLLSIIFAPLYLDNLYISQHKIREPSVYILYPYSASNTIGFLDLFFIQILLLKFCIILDFPVQCRYYHLSCKTDRKNHLCLYPLHLVKIQFLQLWQLFLLHLL